MRYLSTVALLSGLMMATQADDVQARQLGAHEHGTGHVNIALEDQTLVIELSAPGSDIVGFEHEATSKKEVAAVEAAKSTLASASEVFILPAAAGCRLTHSTTKLNTHGADGHGAHEDKTAEEEYTDTATHDRAHEGDGGGAVHGEMAEHAEAEVHMDGAEHSEFTTLYEYQCANIAAVTEIKFPYFKTFPRAKKLQGQLVNGPQAYGFNLTRKKSLLKLNRAQ